jgi:hypothetical protein
MKVCTAYIGRFRVSLDRLIIVCMRERNLYLMPNITALRQPAPRPEL